MEKSTPITKRKVKKWEWGVLAAGLISCGVVAKDKGFWDVQQVKHDDGSTSMQFMGPKQSEVPVSDSTISPSQLAEKLKAAAAANPWCADNDAGSIEISFGEKGQKYGVCADETTIKADSLELGKVTVNLRTDPATEQGTTGPGLFKTFQANPQECEEAKAGIDASFHQAVEKLLGRSIAEQAVLIIQVDSRAKLENCGEQ